jgi:hypothetical protein
MKPFDYPQVGRISLILSVLEVVSRGIHPKVGEFTGSHKPSKKVWSRVKAGFILKGKQERS